MATQTVVAEVWSVYC